MASSDRRDAAIERRLRQWFERSGWVQNPPDPAQRAKRKDNYKRGYEARLSAAPDEAPQLQHLLRRAGFRPGAPFVKSTRVVFPLYGKEQVRRFLQLVGGNPPFKRSRS